MATTWVGEIAELWRYPVKSMQGERCATLTVGPLGIAGDRRFAFESVDAPVGKPLLRAAERGTMLRTRASLEADGAVNLHSEAGVVRDLQQPDSVALLGVSQPGDLRLLARERPFTDVRPIAMHSVESENALAAALGSFDGRQLRSNIIIRFASGLPFAEDALAGRVIRLGAETELLGLERVPRCRMVSLDPETSAPDNRILRWLALNREGRIGVYARARISGVIAEGDAVSLID